MATGVQTWSLTPVTNATADTNINWAEGMAPSAVNDSARALMASVARWRDDNNGTLVTAGTSAAFTLATNQVESALTAGFTVAAQFHITSDTSATLAVDGLAAKPLRAHPGVVLNGGEFGGGGIFKFTYSTTGTGEWVQQQPAVFTTLANTLAVDATVNSSTVFVDGPSVTQGTSGTWFISGTLTFTSASGAPAFIAKLWDGTTTIGQAKTQLPAISQFSCASISGVMTSPAGNLRLSAIRIGNSGTMMSTLSSITAIRIG